MLTLFTCRISSTYYTNSNKEEEDEDLESEKDEDREIGVQVLVKRKIYYCKSITIHWP